MNNFEIPKPCSEKISEMRPVDKGYYCSVCTKCITDFRGMKVEEIKEQLTKATKPCGVFYPHQIEELNLNPTYKYPLWLRNLTVGALGSLSLMFQAQEKPIDYQISETETFYSPDCVEETENANEPKVEKKPIVETIIKTKDTLHQTLKGIVIDMDDFPIADAKISIKGKDNQEVLTNSDGEFEIEAIEGDTLMVESYGLKREFPLTKVNFKHIQTYFIEFKVSVGIIVTTRKFPNNVFYTLSYPYRKVRQWIRSY